MIIIVIEVSSSLRERKGEKERKDAIKYKIGRDIDRVLFDGNVICEYSFVFFIIIISIQNSLTIEGPIESNESEIRTKEEEEKPN